MKKAVIALTLGIILIAGSVYAQGDLTVEGTLSVGEITPLNARIPINGSIDIQGGWEGIYFGGTQKGLIWKNSGMHFNQNSLPIGRDSSIVELIWDTWRDGAWAYCEGVSGSGTNINCADYGDSGLMGSDDYYFVWKHGYNEVSWPEHSDTRDIKFVYDGDTNDGVMGFMDDEDYFYYDDDVVFNANVGIGTVTPQSALAVSGLPVDAVPDSSGHAGALCITKDGNIWIDSSGSCPAGN